MKKKLIYITLGAILAIGTGAAYIWNGQKGLEVETIKIKPQSISKSLTQEGIVQPAEDQIISSMISGRISKLAVQEGQFVQEKDLILEIDSTELQQKKVQAEKNADAQLAQAQAQQPLVDQALRQVEQAKVDLTKKQALADAGALAQNELDEAKYLLSDTESAYQGATKTQIYLQSLADASRLQAKQLTEDIRRSTVVATKDGYIKNLAVKKGSFLSPQTEVCLISSQDKLLIEALIQTENVTTLNVGDPVEIQIKQDEIKRTATGQIEEILPYAVEKVSPLGLTERRVPVKVAFDPEQLPLKPGYNADLVFILARAEQALAVPKTAIFAYEDGYAVWLVKEGEAQIQTVKQDFKSTYDVVISDGLKTDDVVIVNGSMEGIQAGTKIAGE